MEKQIIELIANDRIHIPMSSLDNKIKRTKAKLAQGIVDLIESDNETEFKSERVYAEISYDDKEKARGMKEAIAEFSREYPKYGAVLRGKIAEKRLKREKYLYFGVHNGSKLTSENYIEVMTSLGLTESTARSLYPDLVHVSRKMAKAREEERSIIVGKYEED